MMLTDEEVSRVERAFGHHRLGPSMPPFFRDFLVGALRDRSPALAVRVGAASPEHLQHLFTLVRVHQMFG